jgi:hypothetical protein
VNDRPATAISLERAAPRFGNTRNPTVRVPLPLRLVMNWIHGWLFSALHEQSLRVDTVKEAVPPAAENEVVGALTS